MAPLRFLILGVLALATCKPNDAPGAADSAFIAAMAELRKLPTGADSAARAAVLRRHGLTPATLEQAARELARTPERAAAVWEGIERPVLPQPDSAVHGRTRLPPETR